MPHNTAFFRQTIMDSALLVFSERGYRRMTMEHVVQRSGVSRPTIYKHFRNKRTLVEAALEHEAQRVLQAVALSGDGQDGTGAQLRRKLETLYEMRLEKPGLARRIAGEMREVSSPAYAIEQHIVTALAGKLMLLAGDNANPARHTLVLEALANSAHQLSIRFFMLDSEAQGMLQRDYIDSTRDLLEPYLLGLTPVMTGDALHGDTRHHEA